MCVGSGVFSVALGKNCRITALLDEKRLLLHDYIVGIQMLDTVPLVLKLSLQVAWVPWFLLFPSGVCRHVCRNDGVQMTPTDYTRRLRPNTALEVQYKDRTVCFLLLSLAVFGSDVLAV